jgi:carbon storage regulator
MNAQNKTTGQEVLHMLVITRREGEEVIVGDPANPLGIVRVATVKGDRVRLAFSFPREIEVHRREVAEQILASKPSIVGTIGPRQAGSAS